MFKKIYSALSKIIRRGCKSLNFKSSLTKSRQFPYEVQVVAENLFVPWALDISADGRIYVTERSGTIRIIENGNLLPEPLITFSPPFVSNGEGGLLGLVLHPNFTQNRYIYVMYTYRDGNQTYSRVVRLVENNNKAIVDKVILDRIPASSVHDGGRLKIGPDNKLYITTGDAGNSSLSQNPTSTAGKILRLELDGSIPEDNPIPNSPIYSLGHRNPQGLTWNSRNMLYATDHGQSAHDEINLILPGGNYGWPLVQGNETSNEVQIQTPIIHSGNVTWAPADIAFINQGPWKDKLLVANLRGEQLLLITLNRNGRTVTSVETQLQNQFGRLREVFQHKDGSIYITTSNRDGRGNINLGDDKIIRLLPR